GAAQAVTPFQDRVALARTARLEVVTGTDAGDAGADDEDVEMLDGGNDYHDRRILPLEWRYRFTVARPSSRSRARVRGRHARSPTRSAHERRRCRANGAGA